jgi:hypothetical protein
MGYWAIGISNLNYGVVANYTANEAVALPSCSCSTIMFKKENLRRPLAAQIYY